MDDGAVHGRYIMSDINGDGWIMLDSRDDLGMDWKWAWHMSVAWVSHMSSV